MGGAGSLLAPYAGVAWLSGQATVCKAVHIGSNPFATSIARIARFCGSRSANSSLGEIGQPGICDPFSRLFGEQVQRRRDERLVAWWFNVSIDDL